MKRDSYLVGRAFKSFLFASVMTVAASQAGAFVDGLMVSWFISDAAMSAINISTPVLQLYFSLSLLLGAGGTIMAGKAIGNHDRQTASGIYSLAVMAAVTIGVLLGAGGMIFFDPLLRILCPDEALSGFAGLYMSITIPSAPIYMLMIVMQMFVALDGEPKRVTAAVSTSIAVNLILDYVFIAICGWGMIGTATATVISYFPAIFILALHFKKKDTLKFSVKTNPGALTGIVKMGTPSGFTAMLMSVQIFICNIVAIRYLGTAGVIVFAVCMYLLRLSMIILTGTIDSFQPVASILAGSDDNRGVAIVVGKAYRFLTVSLSIFAGLMVLFPRWIGIIFGIEDAATLAVVESAIPVYALNIILQCAIGLLIPIYQVYSNTRQAMLISVGQPLLPMLFFWIMAAAGGNAWLGFAVGQVALLLLLLLAVVRKGNGKIPFFLIPRQSTENVYDTSIVPDMNDMGQQLLEADGWLRKAGAGESLSFRVGVACEEILKNIADHAEKINKKVASVDMRISLLPKKIIVMIHDDGRPFNPVEQAPETGLGLQIAKGICDNMKYEYLFHQNILTMTWDMDTATASPQNTDSEK